MKRIYIAFAAALLMMAGCTNSGKLTKRYRSVAYMEDHNKISYFISASVFINEKDKEPSAKPRVILDALSPQGQKALVMALDGKESATDTFLTALTSSFASKQEAIEILDYTKFEKRINISVENLSHAFGNRIARFKGKLKFSSNVKIVSCDRLVTQYQTIELGKLNYSNSSGFEGSASAGIGYSAELGNTGGSSGKNTSSSESSSDNLVATGGNESAWTSGSSNTITSNGNIGASAKYTGSRSFAEEVMLRQRIVALGASIDIPNNTLNLYQESISGIDLTGTTFADVAFSTDDVAVRKVFSFTNLVKPDGTIVTPNSIKVKQSRILYHNLTSDVTATFSYSGDYRSIVKGAKTISESDDKIELYYGDVAAQTITLLRKEQLRPKMWVITAGAGRSLPVTIGGTMGYTELVFTSYTDASGFLYWLQRQTLAGNALVMGNNRLVMPSDFTSLNAMTIIPN